MHDLERHVCLREEWSEVKAKWKREEVKWRREGVE
jgi:hypothetical protein